MASLSQMFSCVDSNSILRHPLNRSSAKHNWSFSKGDRFTPQKKIYCDSFYDLPSTKNNRKTSFGYGKKTDLEVGKHRHQVTPPPNTYSIPTFADANKIHKKGFTPLYSREQTAPMSYIQLQPTKVPGPGRYQQYRHKDTPNWSMGPRVSKQIFPKTTQVIVPGPGSHLQIDAINPIGKYYQSNYRNSKAKVWNPKNSSRFTKSFSYVPGPGNYVPKNDLAPDGIYVLSTTPSAGKRTFMLGRRNSFVEENPRRVQTPGPGSYRIPSDFGQYDQPFDPKKMIEIADQKRANQSKGTNRTSTTKNKKQKSAEK